MSNSDTEERFQFTPGCVRAAEKDLAQFRQPIERNKGEDSKLEGRQMNKFTGDRVRFDLSREEYEHLLITLGYAIGAATRDGDVDLKNAALRIANAMNRGNPNWIPYEVNEPAGE